MFNDLAFLFFDNRTYSHVKFTILIKVLSVMKITSNINFYSSMLLIKNMNIINIFKERHNFFFLFRFYKLSGINCLITLTNVCTFFFNHSFFFFSFTNNDEKKRIRTKKEKSFLCNASY